jgi:N utilization substance protein B
MTKKEKDRATRAQRAIRLRRGARVVALQTLYEYDTAQHDVDAVLARHLGERPDLDPDPDLSVDRDEEPESARLTAEAQAFASQLVHGALDHLAEIDARIQRLAPEWPLAQMAHIDKNILRLAIYEIVYAQSPAKVAINEAVELAKTFGSDASSRFVNGVLGAVYAQEQQEQQVSAVSEHLNHPASER